MEFMADLLGYCRHGDHNMANRTGKHGDWARRSEQAGFETCQPERHSKAYMEKPGASSHDSSMVRTVAVDPVHMSEAAEEAQLKQPLSSEVVIRVSVAASRRLGRLKSAQLSA